MLPDHSHLPYIGLKNATGRRRPKTYQAYDPTNWCTDTHLWSFCHTRGASSATRISTKGCRYPPPFCRRRRVQRRAFTLTWPLRSQGFTLSPSSPVRTFHGAFSPCAACGVAPAPSAQGFCGGTAQQGAAYQRGVCLCPVISWVTACR
jgi:hypothetical protein